MNHTGHGSDPVEAILGSAPAVAELRGRIRRLAGFDSVRSPHVPTILICGETGTGKGLVARTLHLCGPRAGGPFVDVNCAAIPETMLEAELFGFEEGAFTDARRAKPGLFESAAGGSLFLDEIDSCSLTLQSKLLKAIEDKSVRRLGAVAAQGVDIKLIAATQRNLADLVAAGQFRADLYHRLAVVVLELPCLRERRDDIVDLARHFAHQYAAAHGLDPKQITDDGARWLRDHPWPGNVRELSHLMERITLLGEDPHIDAATCERLCLPVAGRSPGATTRAAAPAAPPRPDESGDADADEAAQIRDALRRAGGNVAAAARLLGIGRNALRYRMRRHEVARPEIGDAAADSPPETTAPAATPAAPRSGPSGPAPAPSWEEKTVASVAIELVLARSARDASRSDPWTIIKRWRARIGEHVRGFGGALVHTSPSRMTAVFGVPRALEQAPQRAVQAGLAIQRLAAESRQRGRPVPQIRMGVHLGSVQFDTSAGDLEDSLLPIDDALALPERLLGHARDGEILVSSQVARRVRDTCDLAERAVDLGAEQAGMRVFVVRGPKRPDKAQAPRDADSGFVGRQRELAFLVESFHRAVDASGQVTFVAGDAGIGKSRLIEEFRRSVADTGHLWIEGRCASYGSRTAFLPIVDGVRRYLGIDDRDDETGSSAKIDAKIQALGLDLSWTRPFLRGLLSMETDAAHAGLDSASRRSETFRAIKAILLREAERQPVVLIVEDLHWIDEASEELLSFLAESIPTARAMLVCTYRPGYQHRFGDRSYHQRLTLTALSEQESAAMVGAALGDAALPEEIRRLIAAKAEGNPFFVEEITASLLEDGSLRLENGQIVLTRRPEDLVIPDTIQDVLIARIDRLQDESRRAIQIASVIGREFALRLLERITDSGRQVQSQVDELRSLELIYEKAMHPELAYMFKHALTHDVAYHSVQQERRTQLHRLIGLAIEELYGDRLAEHYETLAHHFDEGDDWKRAIHYHDRAAEKAAEGHANHSVVHHCRKALGIAAVMGESIEDPLICAIEERLGLALFYLSDYAESGKAYERASARARAADRRALLLSSAGLSYFWAHDYDNANRLLASARDLATAEHDDAGLSVFHYLQGSAVGITAAEMQTYAHHCDIGLELEQRSGSDIAAAIGCFARAELCEWTGRYQEAIEIAERGIQLGRKLRLSHLIIWPMWFGAKASCCIGNYGAAIARLQEAADICSRIGDRAWSSRMFNTLGWCYAEIGAHEVAAFFNRKAAEIARDFGDPEIIANSEINLALNHLAAGDVDRAADLVAPIAADLARSTDPWMRWRFSLHVLNAQAKIAIVGDDLDAALTLADAQAAGARTHEAPKIEARAASLRAELLLAMDRRAEAHAALRAAAELADRIQYRRGNVEVLRLSAEAHRRDGNDGAAGEAAARARSLLHEAARSLEDSNLRGHLLAQLP
jgi:DNA-binding NtrC family response regulator/predicted ATPase